MQKLSDLISLKRLSSTVSPRASATWLAVSVAFRPLSSGRGRTWQATRPSSCWPFFFFYSPCSSCQPFHCPGLLTSTLSRPTSAQLAFCGLAKNECSVSFQTEHCHCLLLLCNCIEWWSPMWQKLQIIFQLSWMTQGPAQNIVPLCNFSRGD